MSHINWFSSKHIELILYCQKHEISLHGETVAYEHSNKYVIMMGKHL